MKSKSFWYQALTTLMIIVLIVLTGIGVRYSWDESDLRLRIVQVFSLVFAALIIATLLSYNRNNIDFKAISIPGFEWLQQRWLCCCNLFFGGFGLFYFFAANDQLLINSETGQLFSFQCVTATVLALAIFSGDLLLRICALHEQTIINT